MNTSARHFSGSEQTGDRRASIEVGLHASHDVVRRRTNRNPIARKIKTRAAAHVGDQWKSPVDEMRVQSFERQIDRLIGTPTLTHDGPRDAITGGEITSGLISAHE